MGREDQLASVREDEEEYRSTGVHADRAFTPPPSLGIFALAVMTFWIVFGAFVYHTNQPENALTSAWQVSLKPVVQTILPEQWGFFTKSPREDTILPYTHSQESGWTSAAMYPHSQAQYAFGWNRVSRAQGVEVGIVYKEVVDGVWTDCSDYGNALDCLDALSADNKSVVPTVANPSPDPTLCGLSAFSKSPPAPWAYANIGQAQQRISITLVEVTC